MKMLRKTKIVGTIGPASESEEMLIKLMNAGLSVARINFSHGGYEDNREKIERIKRAREKTNKPVGLMLDTKGPEIRTGVLEDVNNKVQIEENQEFTFVHDEIEGNNTKVSIGYKDLYKDVVPGAKILVDDGAIAFEVTEIREKDIICKALNAGKLGSRKTVNVPGLKLNLPALSPKDIEDITKGVEGGFDFIAASFVRRASDVQEIRNLLNANGGEDVQIISKIESQEGIENFDEILEVSDGIMVARGDLGVEIPMEQVPVVQKQFIKKCNAAGKPVITATQMLESMTLNPRPTRAEVSDVANAVYDRTSCIMLSGECAMGKYPVECVETMVKISNTIEDSIDYWKKFLRNGAYKEKSNDMEKNIAYTTCSMAEHIDAAAITTYTHTGNSVKKLAGLGAGCPIIAVTDNRKTFNQLSIACNVMPFLVEGEETPDITIEKGIEQLKEKGILEKGDVVVLSGGAQTFVNETCEKKVIGGITKI
ncbi:MAG: pyruvate kinase [Clostridia bacterium]|nr:pyruvate kinase [Clostridia bacterium]